MTRPKPLIASFLVCWLAGLTGAYGLTEALVRAAALPAGLIQAAFLPVALLWLWLPYRLAKWGDEQYAAGFERGRAEPRRDT